MLMILSIFIIRMADTMFMIYLVLAIIILHIISLPLMFGVNVDVNTDINVGKISISFMFIPVFRKKINIKRLLSGQDIDREDKEESKNNGENKGFKKFLTDCAIKILKFVCVKSVSLYSKIGTGDAAADGMAVGMLRIMYTQFCAFFGFNGDGGKIEPEYNAEVIVFDFFGIFSISFADIIFAVLCAVAERFARLTTARRNYENVT